MQEDQIIDKEQERLARAIEEVDLGYEYPRTKRGERLNLRPGSPLHTIIARRIDEYVKMSRSVTRKRFPELRKIDRTMETFVPLSAWEKAQKERNSKVPIATVLPLSRAARDSWLSYMQTTVAGPAIHRYKGVGGKRAVIAAALRQRVVAKQSLWFNEALHLNTCFSDAFTHAVGFTCLEWRKKRATKTLLQRATKLVAAVLKDRGISVNEDSMLRYADKQVIAEGSKLVPIDIYSMFWDMNVSPNDIQDATYIGYIKRGVSALGYMEREQDPEEHLFNGEYARMAAAQGQGSIKSFLSEEDEKSGRGGRYGSDGDKVDPPSSSVSVWGDELNVEVNLVPSEWGLGGGRKPERWKFKMFGPVIVQCYPLNLDHGMSEFAVFAPNADGHLSLPTSQAAVAFGMQVLADWWVNSRVDNVVTSVNARTILDPTVIDPDSYANPEAGDVVLKRPNAYGQSLKDAIYKDVTPDVTANHMSDLAVWIPMFKEISGMADAGKGDFSNLPDRPGAGGISAAISGSTSHYRYLARMLGMQGMQDLGWQMAYNTDQFMEKDVQVSAYGDDFEMELMAEFGADDISVTPFDLDPSFDLIPYDGTVPEKEDMGALAEVIKTLIANPDVLLAFTSEYNVVGLLATYFRREGFENLQNYRLPKQAPAPAPMVVPDDVALQQEAAGNLVRQGDLPQ